MEQKDIDIYEILKGMPDGTPLYTPMCGNVEFTSVAADKEKTEAIWTEDKNGEYSFDKHGKWMKGGEVLLFPSKEMRDWSKFFKEGDVLEYKGENNIKGTCIFDSYDDNMTKLHFIGMYTFTKGEILETSMSFRTADWVKSDDPSGYIKTIEERLGGKLNLETMEIVKPAFEIGKLYVFDEEDEDGNVTIIGKLIGKNEDTLSFGDQYEIENEKFVTDQAFDLRISVHEELREATELEVELFNKHYFIWKKAKEQPAFKTFDKVLVRNEERCKWQPAFFFRDRGEEAAYRYEVLSIQSGRVADFPLCIQYEGNEHLAFTSDPLQRAYGE